ncbi:ATP-binding protein [Luteolibacter sp. Populi]|uniref:ATP-binding protein n=1 Tax=Luteolibacter sp. Populi TaxID=3230487 RepID=UPI0034667A3A
MSVQPSVSYLAGLVSELRKQPVETPWLEFKRNYANPEDIGEYISALANMAALHGKANGYAVWGIDDGSHSAVGTVFRPSVEKKGNEDLLNWLVRLLTPRLHFEFHEFEYEGKPVVLLEVPRASGQPVQFQGTEFIRVGSHRKKLKEHPEIERELWQVFDTTPFEDTLAMEHVDAGTVLQLLDYPAYFDLLAHPLPENRAGILERLEADRMIVPDGAGDWNITMLGGILFAKDLDAFRSLSRKAIRVIVYEGNSRLQTRREQTGKRGYANGFTGLIEFINTLVPKNEFIGPALRKEVPMYPELAIRELVANAIIHQNFAVTGAGPMIEIFADRMEITNPGQPLILLERFLDSPPRSRNEALASFMRRIHVCEERGSGIDKVVAQTELYQLPAPLFETPPDSTRATLFAHRKLSRMSKEDRVRACYFHACLKHVEHDPMTNSSLRHRFSISDENRAMATRIINEAVAAKFVKPFDLDQGRRFAKYLPYWA